MARIQQKTSGRRFKREKQDAAAIREALTTALKDRGMQMPRFGRLGAAPREKHPD